MRHNGDTRVLFSALTLASNFDWTSYEESCDSCTSVTSFTCFVSWVRFLNAFFKLPKLYLKELELVLWKTDDEELLNLVAQSVSKVQRLSLSFFEVRSKDYLLRLLEACDAIVEITVRITSKRAQLECAEDVSSYLRALVESENLEKIQMVFNGRAGNDTDKNDADEMLNKAKGPFRARPCLQS